MNALSYREQPVERNVPFTTWNSRGGCLGEVAQDSVEKRCIKLIQRLIALPNFSLSLFFSHKFRKYSAVLNLQFALPFSQEGFFSILEESSQAIKEEIVQEEKGLLERRSLFAYGAESVPRIIHWPNNPLRKGRMQLWV